MCSQQKWTEKELQGNEEEGGYWRGDVEVRTILKGSCEKKNNNNN